MEKLLIINLGLLNLLEIILILLKHNMLLKYINYFLENQVEVKFI